MNLPIKIGVAGIPLSSVKQDIISGISRIHELGLDGMELEFVHGVKMSEATALKVVKEIQAKGLFLTAHAPYYINLNSKEELKLQNTYKHILDTARIASLCGASSFTFHPAFYLKDEPEVVFETVLARLLDLKEQIVSGGYSILISPETTGKPSVFGSLSEILQLCAKIPGLNLCVDFAHLHARSNGKYNSYEEFMAILDQIAAVNPALLHNLHMHVSGIQYSIKGEIRHLPLKDSDFNYLDLLRALVTARVSGFLICESPILEEDALLLQQTYLKILEQA
jgi:deoxyribonuclease-4